MKVVACITYSNMSFPSLPTKLDYPPTLFLSPLSFSPTCSPMPTYPPPLSPPSPLSSFSLTHSPLSYPCTQYQTGLTRLRVAPGLFEWVVLNPVRVTFPVDIESTVELCLPITMVSTSGRSDCLSLVRLSMVSYFLYRQ